jgi:hypothetical protein
MINDGYAVCSNEWAIDKDIKNELGLLLILSSLCADKGYCWATNEYLSNLFDETDVNISRKINKLEEKGYISIQYEKQGCKVTKRIITINKFVNRYDYQKCYATINKNVKENNTSINNYYLFINKIINTKNQFTGNETDKVNQAFVWATNQPEFNQLSPKEQNNIKMEIYGR